MRNKRIMIIDDDVSVRQCMTDALVLENYDVTTAQNGQDALDQLFRFSVKDLPECIIVDLMMPVMGGHQFLETLTSDHRPYICNIPVIVATAQTRMNGERLHPKAKALLSKPLDIFDLYSAVECSLRKKLLA